MENERIKIEQFMEEGRTRMEKFKAAMMTEHWERNPLLSFSNDEYDPYYEMTTSEDYIKGVIDTDDVSIENIFTPNDTSNIIISVGDQELHLHKEVLCKHSPVFEEMLNDNNETKIKLPEKNVNSIILFFSYLYPDREIPLKDKFDLIGLLQLCIDYKTDLIKETIEDHLLRRVSIFYDDEEFTKNTYAYKAFKYRKSKQNRGDSDEEDTDNEDDDTTAESNDDSMRRSYDDTLVLYFLYLAEKFNLERIISSCKCYLFEAELCDLKDFDGFNILEIFSEESKNHINVYYLKRALRSYRHNKNFEREQGNILEQALDTALDEICRVKPERCCVQQAKRKKIEESLQNKWLVAMNEKLSVK